MTELFGKSGLALLEAFTFTRTLYAFDFDGTLARIVRSPDNARMSRTTEQLLRRLGELAPVAILSGRSVADLRRRLGFTPAYLVGNHGLEGAGEAGSCLELAARTCEKWKLALATTEWPAGAEVEDKTYSLALHFRRARARAAARKKFVEAIAALEPAPRVVGGKFVINLLPPGAPHKGAALLGLLRRAGRDHVLYVGDDETDEDVFGLEQRPGQALTVRVGRSDDSRAAFFLERQSQIDRLLRLLIRYHEAGKGAGVALR